MSKQTYVVPCSVTITFNVVVPKDEVITSKNKAGTFVVDHMVEDLVEILVHHTEESDDMIKKVTGGSFVKKSYIFLN